MHTKSLAVWGGMIMAIILRLDRVMADRKMSLTELAVRVGISNVNLSNLKTGKVKAVRFSTLDKICDVLSYGFRLTHKQLFEGEL